jgi:hypothetical protein
VTFSTSNDTSSGTIKVGGGGDDGEHHHHHRR